MLRLLYLLICLPFLSIGQYMFDANAVYSDSFTEWDIRAEVFEDDEWHLIDGIIQLNFEGRNDWSSWNFELQDIDITCRLKWRNNFNHWVMYTPDELITIRTVWKDDFMKWKITSSSHIISIESRYRNLTDEWELKSKSIGEWKMYTGREGDPKEWIIEDDLIEAVDIYHKLAMTFIVLFNSSPKD